MFDPMLHHIDQARQTAEWIAQIVRLDPDLGIPAAMPLVAARLMGALGPVAPADAAEADAEWGDEDALGI